MAEVQTNVSTTSKTGPAKTGGPSLAAEAAGKSDNSAAANSAGTPPPFRIFSEEDDDFYKKWAGPMLLGPFVPALLSMLVILSGQIVLNTWTGTCGYALTCKFDLIILSEFFSQYLTVAFAAFISAAIAMCYLFLLVYSWVFIGDDFVIEISLLEMKLKLFRPFKSLKWFMLFMGVIAFTSFIVWCVGSYLLQSGFFCAVTSPGLYAYTTFLVAVYWIGFIIIVFYLVKLYYGDFLLKMAQEQMRVPTMAELEERVFRKTFSQFDKEREGKISRDSVPEFLQQLGVYVPDEEIPALLKSLDPDETGIIKYDPCYAWFRKVNDMANEKEAREEAAKKDKDRGDKTVSDATAKEAAATASAGEDDKMNYRGKKSSKM